MIKQSSKKLRVANNDAHRKIINHHMRCSDRQKLVDISLKFNALIG